MQDTILRPHMTGNDSRDLSELLPIFEQEQMHGNLQVAGYTLRLAFGKIVKGTRHDGRALTAKQISNVLAMVLPVDLPWSWRRVQNVPTSYIEVPVWQALLGAAQAA